MERTDHTPNDDAGGARIQTGDAVDSLTAAFAWQSAQDAEEENTRRAAFIAALRAAATFFETHPNVKCPRYTTMHTFVDSREELAANAKGASWEKSWGADYFFLKHIFCDDLVLEVNASRSTVCRKVVTGTRIVPAQPEQIVEEYIWQCDDASLLATRADLRGGEV